jgi:glycerol-3-phosphate dehydrogenase (NAD(P)+)
MPVSNAKVAILGGGSWATALMKLLLCNLSEVGWYIRNPNTIQHIQHHKRNPHYLSDVLLKTSKIKFYSSVKQAVEENDLIIMAIPAAFLENELKTEDLNLKNKLIISAVKGMIPSQDKILANFLIDNYDVSPQSIAVLAGPCHAEEIALERLSYLTIASENTKLATFVAEKLRTRFLHTSISEDLYGTEYAAVLKNIFALAAGICHGLGYGDNFQAVLISNAIQEIERFTSKVHPITRDIKDSAYLGDLMVTAYSTFSRNRNFGNMIGKGYSVAAAFLELNMVAEGYFAVNSIYHINRKFKAEMPITDAVYRILYMHENPAEEIKKLTRKLS